MPEYKNNLWRCRINYRPISFKLKIEMIEFALVEKRAPQNMPYRAFVNHFSSKMFVLSSSAKQQ